MLSFLLRCCHKQNCLTFLKLQRPATLKHAFPEKAGYNGEFYFKATFYTVIYKEIGQLYYDSNIKTFQLKLYAAKNK